jgi:hypothetical protein
MERLLQIHCIQSNRSRSTQAAITRGDRQATGVEQLRGFSIFKPREIDKSHDHDVANSV